MISLIAAVAQNNCIGKNGELPWKIPEDMKRVREITTGKVVLMGRKTWESLPEKFRPLPKRTNVVITRDTAYRVPAGVGVEVYSTITAAIAAHPSEDIIGFGGAQIYAEMIGRADVLYITHVHETVDGDAFFPVIDKNIWQEAEREDHTGFSFVTYKRKF